MNIKNYLGESTAKYRNLFKMMKADKIISNSCTSIKPIFKEDYPETSIWKDLKWCFLMSIKFT